MSFVHLHLHAHLGSRLDGISSSEDYCKKALEYNHPAIAITDHGRLNGIYEHQEVCLKNNIKPIIGMEMYLANELEKYEVSRGKERRVRTRNSHIILLAKNKTGYENLLYLNYLSMKDATHFYYNPRITQEELFEHSEGIVVGTACLANPFISLLRGGKVREAVSRFSKYVNVFKDDFFVELQINELTHSIDELNLGQKTANDFMIRLANKFGIPIVFTGDVHYAEQGQDKLQTLSIAIRDKATIDNLQFELESKELFYHDVKDFIDFNERWRYGYSKDDIFSWCHNTKIIADKCDFLIPKRKRLHLPKTSENDDKKLINFSMEGLRDKFKVEEYKEVPKEYRKRLEMELEVIMRKGFSSYCLILEDIYKYADNEKIYKGPARGCFTKNNLVKMSDGSYKKISMVKVGDLVFSRNSIIQKVLNRFKYKIKEEIVEIELEDGKKINCTKDHKILCIRDKKEVWVKAEGIIENDFIVSL